MQRKHRMYLANLARCPCVLRSSSVLARPSPRGEGFFVAAHGVPHRESRGVDGSVRVPAKGRSYYRRARGKTSLVTSARLENTWWRNECLSQ